MKKIGFILVLIFFSILNAENLKINCNNSLIYESFKILSNSLKENKVITSNTILKSIIVKPKDKLIIKEIEITDKNIIKNIKDNLYKKIAKKLQKEKQCKLYLSSKLGKCFLKDNTIIEEYYSQNKKIFDIIINEKNCKEK